MPNKSTPNECFRRSRSTTPAEKPLAAGVAVGGAPAPNAARCSPAGGSEEGEGEVTAENGEKAWEAEAFEGASGAKEARACRRSTNTIGESWDGPPWCNAACADRVQASSGTISDHGVRNEPAFLTGQP